MKYWIPATAWMGLILFVSTMKTSPGMSEVWPVLGHFFEYAVLAVLLGWALLRTTVGTDTMLVVTAVAIAGLYGITIEVIQIFIPTRSFSVADMLVNLIGAVTGVGVWSKVRR